MFTAGAELIVILVMSAIFVFLIWWVMVKMEKRNNALRRGE